MASNLEKWGNVGYNLVCISKRTVDHLYQNHLVNQLLGVFPGILYLTLPSCLSCIKVLRSGFKMVRVINIVSVRDCFSCSGKDKGACFIKLRPLKHFNHGLCLA